MLYYYTSDALLTSVSIYPPNSMPTSLKCVRWRLIGTIHTNETHRFSDGTTKQDKEMCKEQENNVVHFHQARGDRQSHCQKEAVNPVFQRDGQGVGDACVVLFSLPKIQNGFGKWNKWESKTQWTSMLNNSSKKGKMNLTSSCNSSSIRKLSSNKVQ